MTLSKVTSLRFPPVPEWLSKSLRRCFSLGLLSAYWVGMLVFAFIAMASKDLPSPQRLWENQRPVSVQIIDRQGRDILVRGAAAAPRVRLDTLPFHIPLTVIAVEDRRYYNHVGIDPEALLRAMVQNIKAGAYVQGGSTITQQLSKNVFLSPDKTLRRKVQEMLMAIWLERNFTKDEILELYLSKVYFGTGAWGLEAASLRYFDKPAAQMNLPEAALLSGLLKAPSAFNPVNHPERAAARTAVVLRVLKDQDLVDAEMYQQAIHHPIRIHRPQSDNSAQYFIDWIWPDIEKALGDAPTQDIVVQTTLDIEAQALAHQAVLDNLDTDRKADQAALITLNGEGAVLAMIGGASYSNSQFNRAIQAKRQPGSAFKPFVYLAALETGITPWDQRDDAPITLTEGGDIWSPQNFNQKFAGNMTVENAFARSINTVAVKIGEEVGRNRVISTAERFGFEGLKPLRSLALGSHVATPMTLTQAYLPFAAMGRSVEPYGILSISTANGTPLYDAPNITETIVMDREILAEMNRMLTRTVEQGTARRAQIKGRDIGGKTGTTNDFRDAWFVGYSSDIVTGIWVGNDKNEAMKRVTGGAIPAQIFQDYMSVYLQTLPESNLIIANEPAWVQQQRNLNNLLNTIEDVLP